MNSPSVSAISFSNVRYTQQVRKALMTDNGAKLEELVRNGHTMNIVIDPENGNTPLHLAIIENKRQCFDFLVNHKSTNLNATNCSKYTPLNVAVKKRYYCDPYYALSLVRKGALVFHGGYMCNSPLTVTSNVLVAHELILKGADVNDTCKPHKTTPIFITVSKSNFNQDVFDCLLFYGGDVTIPEIGGSLPFFECRHPEIEETLFNLTFDSLEHYEVRFEDFVELIERESPFFYQLLKLCSGIDCDHIDYFDWEDFENDHQLMMLSSLLNKFKYLAACVMLYWNPLHETPENLEKIIFALDETYASDIMIEIFNETAKDLAISPTRYNSRELILYLVSKGVQVTSKIMDKIYGRQGFSELFETLLHTEIVPLERYNCRRHIYDPNYIVSINDTCDFIRVKLVKFFHQSKGVPSLMELSREVARRHLVSSYAIKSSGMYLSVLKCLPIPRIIQDVLCYKQPLY